MTRSDAHRWDERWSAAAPTPPAAPDVLVTLDLLDLLDPADVGAPRALDVACGTGSASRWLARRGWAVVALDVSPVAIGRLRAAAAADALDDGGPPRTGPIEARVVDLDDGLPHELGRFDLVLCQRFRDPALVSALVEATAPGGLCAVSVLSVTGAPDPGPFHAPPGELASAFARGDVEVLGHDESDGTESIVVRRRTPPAAVTDRT